MQTDMMWICAVWVKPWVKDTAQLPAETALRLPAAVRSTAVGIKVFFRMPLEKDWGEQARK